MTLFTVELQKQSILWVLGLVCLVPTFLFAEKQQVESAVYSASCRDMVTVVEQIITAWTQLDLAKSIAVIDQKYLRRDCLKACLELYAVVYWYLKTSSSSACSSEERARADALLEAVMRAVPENFSTVADVMRETAALWDGERS